MTSFCCSAVIFAFPYAGSREDVISKMGSKFFTWTKGDRRNASEALRSGGVVPLPVECIKIKGMDYARSEKVSQHTMKVQHPLLMTLVVG